MKKIILTTIIGLGLTSSFFYIGTVAREKADKPVVQQKEEQSEKNEIQGDEKEEKKEEKQQQEIEKKTEKLEQQDKQQERKSTVTYEEIQDIKKRIEEHEPYLEKRKYNSFYAIDMAISKTCGKYFDLKHEFLNDGYLGCSNIKIELTADKNGHFKLNKEGLKANQDLKYINVDKVAEIFEGITDNRVLDIKNKDIIVYFGSQYGTDDIWTNIYIKGTEGPFKTGEQLNRELEQELKNQEEHRQEQQKQPKFSKPFEKVFIDSINSGLVIPLRNKYEFIITNHIYRDYNSTIAADTELSIDLKNAFADFPFSFTTAYSYNMFLSDLQYYSYVNFEDKSTYTAKKITIYKDNNVWKDEVENISYNKYENLRLDNYGYFACIHIN